MKAEAELQPQLTSALSFPAESSSGTKSAPAPVLNLVLVTLACWNGNGLGWPAEDFTFAGILHE
ncbi:hypothetical protein P7K49_005780 [Saguinus oedipus]|uniref:Uncharacterized protein n=1 Tax=Saguinus oedipus TaxID=9490 RepID=A0ABQ9W0I9_SAGOE|nr:hypothetical protein P7K49_005780 [Saguinus oedipus]